MRSILLLSSLVLLAACGGERPPVHDDSRAGEVHVYEVFGMDCPGCHGGVEKLVERIPGVLEATASWKDQRVVLLVEDGAEVAQAEVREAIRRANFTPGERLEPR